MKIAVSTSSFAEFDSTLLNNLKAVAEVCLNPYGRTLKETEAIDFISGCHGLLAGTEPLSATVLAALPNLRVISRCGAGVDNVDLAYAEKHGIQVFSTPDAPTLSVVELTLALALDLARCISRHDRELRSGIWKKHMGRLLSEKKVGVIGFGRIGRKVAGVFLAMGCEVAVCDPFVRAEDYPNLTLDALLPWADVVTLHCLKSPDGQAVLTAERLARLHSEAWVINAARGGLVDEEALYLALKAGRIGGAALDVFSSEPYSGQLTELDNVVLTPHVGSYAREARIKMEMHATENLLKALLEGS